MARNAPVKKFMNGLYTAQDVYRAYGVRKSCEHCGAPASVRIRVLVALDELTKRQPDFVAAIMASNPDGLFVPTVQTTHGPMVKVSDVGVCDRCRKSAEIAAAHVPSWAIVEIGEGPNPKNAIHAQVPRIG